MKFPVPKTLTEAISPIIAINWFFGFGVIQYPIGRRRPIISAFWSTANFLTYMSFLMMANFPGITEIKESKIAATNYRSNAYFCVAFVAISMCLANPRSKVVTQCINNKEEVVVMWKTSVWLAITLMLFCAISRNVYPPLKPEKALGRIFTRVNVMNGRLKILGIPNDYQLTLKVQIIELCLAFASILTIMVLNFKYVAFEFPSDVSRLGFFMTFHHFLVLAFVVDTSFSSSIRYFSNRFRRLNVLLVESDSLERSGATVAQGSEAQFLHSFSLIREIHGNNSPSIRAAHKQWLLYVIKETRKLHRGLCKMATELNRAFGLQVLLSVTLSVGLITTFLYTSYIIASVSSSHDSFLEDWTDKTITLLWVAFYAMKVLLIVNACETTSCEANRTAGLISKLLDTTACDEDIRDEVLRGGVFRAILIGVQSSTVSVFTSDSSSISTFSLQLIQNPLKFTASGFFTIDYSLVHGIIGSVVTYLVIMIQMRSIYESETVESTPNCTMRVPTNDTDQKNLVELGTHVGY